jgi:hypothetical protein
MAFWPPQISEEYRQLGKGMKLSEKSWWEKIKYKLHGQEGGLSGAEF